MHIEQLIHRNKQLAPLKNEIQEAVNRVIKVYENEGKLLICGNGGSSADSDHLVCELMQSFERKRPLNQELKTALSEVSGAHGEVLSSKLQQGLPAISLSAHTALTTAIANDMDSNLIFAQQVAGYGNAGDCLISISTSGNSQNVVDALIVAKAKGLTTIGFSGEKGGKMKEYCDILINVRETRTAYIQELHLPIFHTLCIMVEEHFFG